MFGNLKRRLMAWNERQQSEIEAAQISALRRRMDAQEARADRQEARLRALLALMGQSARASGQPVPDLEETQPMFQLIRGERAG